MKEKIYIGTDTSNYTTSAAAVTASGEVFSAKRLLSVPAGQNGMRQSDALFCHTRDLPSVFAELTGKIREKHPSYEICGIGASETPRRKEGSYMPCFLAGVNAAKCAASAIGCPYYGFSHQEGHIMAAIRGSNLCGTPFPEDAGNFYALHLSGGTGELLFVTREKDGFFAEITASTLDITLGQLVDRCGVMAGLPFPAGKYAEEYAAKRGKYGTVKIPKKENGINLSGFENKFIKKKEENTPPEELFGYVFDVLFSAVAALLDFIPEEKRKLPVLFSGGVMSSSILKERLKEKGYSYFAPPEFSSDNAIGTAFLTKMKGEGAWNP